MKYLFNKSPTYQASSSNYGSNSNYCFYGSQSKSLCYCLKSHLREDKTVQQTIIFLAYFMSLHLKEILINKMVKSYKLRSHQPLPKG